MAAPSPNYKKLYLEGKEKVRMAEEKLRMTTLPEFLNACHNHLHLGLRIRDATMSTQGCPSNAKNKLRPDKLLSWKDFPRQQAAIWGDLMESHFVSERHFTSLHGIEEFGRNFSSTPLGSELDLHFFQRSTVDTQVSLIIEKLYNLPTLRQKFGLRGSVTFENHGNTLSPESQLVGDMEQITVSGTQQRRSARLNANNSMEPAKTVASTRAGPATSSRPRAGPATSSRPRADQFCVYNTSTQNEGNRVAAFVMEYKAPHKLSLSCISQGLEDMELEDVVQDREKNTEADNCRRLIAAVITQAFSYMVQIGVEYGCVCTGEAYVFLRVPEDPRTVYYFLSVPNADVGGVTGWAPDSDGPNRLHLTAVGQMLAFTLLALKTQLRDQRWRSRATAQLKTWEIVYYELLDTMTPKTAKTSDYQPSRDNVYLRMSPIRLRRKPGSSNCQPPQDPPGTSDEEPDTDDTPSKLPSLPQGRSRAQNTTSNSTSRTSAQGAQSRQKRSPQGQSRAQTTTGNSTGRVSTQGAQSGQYCTQDCLLGLMQGGPLDMQCPNVRVHGEQCHQIDRPAFLARVRQQLSEDLDTDCEPVSRPGSCGVLFRVRLKSHGYTIAAKATPIDFVHRLQWEASIYDLLRPIQGIHVPVYLGSIDLETSYKYEGICELVHMMLLSFGGELISQHITTKNRVDVARLADSSAQAIHNLGILHADLEPRNMLWNKEMGQVMVIDFERAKIVERRATLGTISGNRKRKRQPERSTAKLGRTEHFGFTQERNKMALGLECLTG